MSSGADLENSSIFIWNNKYLSYLNYYPSGSVLLAQLLPGDPADPLQLDANMNLKLALFSCAFGILSSVSASAAQIVFSNLNGLHPITNPAGNLVPSGTGFAQLGSFGALSDAEIIAGVNNRAALAAAFEEFGTTTTFGSGSPGFFSAMKSAPIPAADPLVGDNIFIVAGDGSRIANSNAIFIFKSDERFQADVPSTFSTTIELNSALATGSILVGDPVVTFVPLVGNSFDGSEMVNLVPEPSPALLAGLTCLVLLGRRRRR